MIPKYESFLQKTILPELERARPNWDRPHTTSVVAKVKEIIKHNSQLQLDEPVLIIAAYAHDWGYVDAFTKTNLIQRDEMQRVKKTHDKRSAQKLEELLNNKVFDFLADSQKQRALHLVRTHDTVRDLKDTDELILMEADTLGALDVTAVTPTYNHKSNERYLISVGNRVDKFITDFGKKEAKRLLKLREDYYKKLL